jgi:hypothetical protein
MQQTYENPSLSGKALQTYTKVGEVKTESSLVQTWALYRNITA